MSGKWQTFNLMFSYHYSETSEQKQFHVVKTWGFGDKVFLSTHKESGIVANSIPVKYKALAGKLKNHLPVEITAVNRTELEPLWDYMVKSYHYLGYKKMIGPRIK